MATEARSWTVTTWNVRGRAKPDLAAVAAALESESPDVIALQEVRKGQAAELAKLIGMRFTWSLKHYPFTPLFTGAAEGLAILTPHALDAAGHSEISDGKSKWTSDRRIAQWALVGRPDTSAYRIYNTHLASDNSAHRREQAVVLAGIVESHGEAPPAIVAGDFNDGADATVIYALPGVEHLSPGFTNPADVPQQNLDHVLVPGDAREVSTTVPGGGQQWAELSDHLPVTVRFTLDWVQGDFT